MNFSGIVLDDFFLLYFKFRSFCHLMGVNSMRVYFGVQDKLQILSFLCEHVFGFFQRTATHVLASKLL